jgi:hypothetical protein
MKQKRHNNKRQNTLTTRNKRTAPSAAYKRIKRATKDSQKSKYNNQTDNKDNNRNIDMSIGLGEEKKLKTKTMDQKEEKPTSSKESVTTTSSPLPASSALPPLQSEVFDSSSDNAMSEMKEVADMGPDETSKVFSHVEEKQQLDPLTTSINDSIKKIDSENSLNTDADPTSLSVMVADPTLEESDSSAMESIKEDIVSKDDIEPNNPQIYNKLGEHYHLDESVRFYGNENGNANKESYSNLSNNDNINPFIIGIKFWQAHNIAWINAYNEFMKAWIDNNKTDPK